MKQSPIIGVTPLWDSERKSLWMLPDYAVRMENKRFVWAVQWHPEYMFTTDKNSMKIFKYFVNFAVAYWKESPR
jgi:gamma-glutamyl-gamma-aminobutyrate hydrolase PuuD